MLSVVWLALMSLFTAAGHTGAAPVDSTYGVYVQDEAGILSSSTERDLYNRALWLKQQTGTAQVAVVTVQALSDQTIEDYAVSKFRELGLGDSARNDGVLLLYNAQNGQVRIEVGYGLEGPIPDGKAGAILDQWFVPYRNTDQLESAFIQTQSTLINEIAIEYGIDPAGITEGGTSAAPPVGGDTGLFDNMPGYMKLLLGIGAVVLIFLDFKFTGGAVTFTLLNLLGRRGSGGRGGGRGGGGSSGGGGASR